jgi:hypothetical protein
VAGHDTVRWAEGAGVEQVAHSVSVSRMCPVFLGAGIVIDSQNIRGGGIYTAREIAKLHYAAKSK